MPNITAFHRPVVLRGGTGTPAVPGIYFGFGTNATFTASTAARIFCGSGAGSPNGILVAPAGSLWISPAGIVYVNTDGAVAWSVLSAAATGLANVIPDPGDGAAIPVAASGEINLTIGAGAETNTLATPAFAGEELLISADTVGVGTRAITASQAINAAGNTIMTFNAVRDNILLVAITVGGALRWQVGFNGSVALS